MGRLELAGSLISKLRDVDSLLDVGCRDGGLRHHIPKSITYFGADLILTGEHVGYVGDFCTVEWDRTFSAVVGLDVLEHMAHPSAAFDKMVSLSTAYIICSLPNCYDLHARARFFLKGRLGDKYAFRADEPLDRHRWVMSEREIEQFFLDKANSWNLDLKISRLQYGANRRRTQRARLGSIATAILPASLTTATVFGVFTKRPRFKTGQQAVV